MKVFVVVLALALGLPLVGSAQGVQECVDLPGPAVARVNDLCQVLANELGLPGVSRNACVTEILRRTVNQRAVDKIARDERADAEVDWPTALGQ
jgi:hypothetical protein